MTRGTALTLLSFAGLAACAAPGGPYPSLQPRVAELIDPRLPVDRPVNDRPVDSDLASRLATLVSQARSSEARFDTAAHNAQQLAAVAGPPKGEGWIAAQVALSAAVEARGPAARAVGDIDALGADRLAANGGLAPADHQAIDEASRIAGAIADRQAEVVRSIQARLGS